MKYVNLDETSDFFEDLLNEMPSLVQIKGISLKGGTILRDQNPEEFVALFNRWVSECIKKNTMVKTRCTVQEKTCVWNAMLSDTSKIAQSYEALKGLV